MYHVHSIMVKSFSTPLSVSSYKLIISYLSTQNYYSIPHILFVYMYVFFFFAIYEILLGSWAEVYIIAYNESQKTGTIKPWLF